MRNFTKIVASLLLLAMVVPVSSAYAQKEKKEKKEKKPFVWEMPALTGNANFDEYLTTCDALNTSITTYSDQIPFYTVNYYVAQDPETGAALINEDGEYETYALIEDQDGVVRNAGGVILQYTTVILSGTNLLLDCTLVTTLTASATLELPNLGVAAFAYGKYVKAGPNIANKGLKEIKEIVEALKEQSASIKTLKEGSTVEGELADVLMSTSSLPEGIDASELPVLDSAKMAEVEAAAADSSLDSTSAEDLL